MHGIVVCQYIKTQNSRQYMPNLIKPGEFFGQTAYRAEKNAVFCRTAPQIGKYGFLRSVGGFKKLF